ncbi:MAG: ABC transporter substrate-binding protein [Oscillospiraceae bacterium]|nr:ABC transporter substrate-binding protein [Oscillospiraceae bacterium]
MKKRIITIIALILVGVFVLTACGPQQVAPEPAQPPDTAPPTDTATPPPAEAPPAEAPGTVVAPPEDTAQDTITIIAASMPVSLIPWGSNDSASSEVNKQIYSHLFVLDYNTFEVVPERGLAVEWSQPDAMTTNIRIREGVVFHNGDPLTAHDVAFSLRLGGESPHSAAFLGMISDAVAHDDYNLTVFTEIPFAPIIRHLAHTAAGIIPMDHYLAVGTDAFENNPVGSGPFMFDNRVLGDRVELVGNPTYWGHHTVLSRLIYRAVPEASVRLAEVQAGTADVALAIAPIDLAGAEADPNVQVIRRMNLSTNYIGFNAQRPHISNPLVRQAINYALDTHAIVDHVFLGTGAAIDGPIAPIVWGFAPQEPFSYDMNRARELLIEAGYNPTPGEPGGFSTTIWWNIGNPQREQIAEMVQFTLAQLNISVEVVGMEWAQYLAETEEGNHDMFILGWVSVTGDADYGLYPLFHSANFGAGGNRTFWYYPPLDELLERGRTEVDPAVRLQIYADAQRVIRDNAPWIFLNQGETLIAANPNLRNFVINPAGHHAYAPVYFVD